MIFSKVENALKIARVLMAIFFLKKFLGHESFLLALKLAIYVYVMLSEQKKCEVPYFDEKSW